MYASVVSCMRQAWRLLDIELEVYPSYPLRDRLINRDSPQCGTLHGLRGTEYAPNCRSAPPKRWPETSSGYLSDSL